MTTTVSVRPAPSLPPRAEPAASAVPAVLRQGATPARRGIVKTIHSPEALIDITLQPIIFLLLFIYVFGGAIAGDPASCLQFALPGVLLQTVVFEREPGQQTPRPNAPQLYRGVRDRFDHPQQPDPHPPQWAR